MSGTPEMPPQHEPVSAAPTAQAVGDAQAHFHKATWEVYHIFEGEGTLELNGRSVPVKPGTAVYLPPGVVHRALGKMRAVVVTTPAYDPEDEHLL